MKMTIYECPTIKFGYNNSPALFQSLMFSTYGLLKMCKCKTPSFKKWDIVLERTQWFSTNKLKELQTKKLRLLIKQAYENVPYYHKKFREADIKPEDIKQLDDLPKVPILRKKDVIENYNQMIARNAKDFKPEVHHTGGTTGTPLKYLIDKDTLIARDAEKFRYWRWHRYSFRDKMAVVRGNVIIPKGKLSKHPWRYDIVQNHLYLSSYHMTEEILSEYVKKLKKWQPKFLQAYPSAAYILGKYMLSIGEAVPLKALLTASETLLPSYRDIIEKAFECDVFDHYGHGEPGCWVSGQCAEKNYHISSEFSIVEIVRGDEVVNYGEKGHIIDTSLTNYSMPFIRYKIGDIGSLSDEACLCGRGLPLMKSIEGRDEDFISTPDGRIVGRLDQIVKRAKHVKLCQIVQDSIKKIIVKIVLYEGYNKADEEKMLEDLRDRLGEEVEIEFRTVDEIPLTKTGKFRFVISKVPIKFD